MSIVSKVIEAVIPGDFNASVKTLGARKVFLLILKAAWRYKRTIWYMLRRSGIKSVINFFYVKLLLPTGEGAGELAYIFLGPVFRLFPQLAGNPSQVEIELLTKCNKRCILCEHTYWNEPNDEVSFDEWKEMIDQFPRLRWINIAGEGDPFLCKDFMKKLRYLKDKKIMVWFDDSFDLLTKEIAEEIVDMGIDGIYVSFDASTKETYEKLKVGCNFERSINNIKLLLDAKKKQNSPIPEICFRYIVNTLNYNEAPGFIDLANSLGSRDDYGDGSKIHFIGVLAYKEIAQYYLSEIPENIQQEMKEKADSYKNGLPVIFAHSEVKKLPPIEKCLAWMEPYLMMKGEVMPCCVVMMSNHRNFLREHSFGNILKQPFKEVWNSERYKRFRNTVNDHKKPVPALCQGCRAYDTTDRARKYGIDKTL